MATADVAIEEGAIQGGDGIQPQVPGLGPVTSGHVLTGSSSVVSRKFRVTALHLATATPAVVVLQPRQSENQDNNFPDQFAVQVIRTTATDILFLIRRVDQETGWGQNLRIDVLVVDQFHNPA